MLLRIFGQRTDKQLIHLIAAVIWSHYHWDHMGNVSLFPSSTSLVVGPGFQSSPTLLPGYPKSLESPVLAADFAGRSLREIDFTTSDLQIGGLPAHDFFGDGSFYLLGEHFTAAHRVLPCQILTQLDFRYSWTLSGSHVWTRPHHWWC